MNDDDINELWKIGITSLEPTLWGKSIFFLGTVNWKLIEASGVTRWAQNVSRSQDREWDGAIDLKSFIQM